MSQKHWAEAMRIFCEWLDLPEPDRKKRLESLAASDPVLSAYVTRLFEARERTEPQLESTAVGVLQHLVDGRAIFNDLDTLQGQFLGPYRLLELVGIGGMGLVYRAVREDIGQIVAVKVLTASASANRLRRFEHEKGHLARLHHPGIASILHADARADGTLFFAMDYIEGERITAYCESHELHHEERLRLFLQVCSAVQAAHNVGILHQDLKPANILVTAAGMAKLLDFGIAERVAEDGAGEERFVSAPYAAPEFETTSPSVSADVFALGIVLYEMLTTELPYEVASQSPGHIRHIVRTSAYLPVSVRARQGQRVKGLSNLNWSELDAICARATSREPAERYATVDALANDVRRLLNSEPVTAVTGRPFYILQTFLRRHETATIAAVITVSAFLVTIAIYTLRLRNATQQAKAETARVLRLQDFQRTTFLSGGGPGLSRSATMETLLDRGVLAASSLSNEPKLQTDEFELLGEGYSNIGLYKKSENLLRRALTERQRLFGAESPEVAQIQSHLAQVLSSDGDDKDAKQLSEHAVAITSKTLPPSAQIRLEAETALAEIDADLDQYAQSIAILTPVVQRAEGSDALQSQLSTALNDLAIAEQALGKLDLAMLYNQRSLDIDLRTLGDRHPDIAAHLLNMADLEKQRKDFAAATGYAQRALAIERDWFGEDSSETLSAEVAYGQDLAEQRRWADAEPVLEQALASIGKLSSPPTGMAALLDNAMGMVKEGEGHLSEADAYYHKALALYLSRSPSGSPSAGVVLTHCASIARKSKQPAKAEADLREALRMFAGELTDSDLRVQHAKNDLNELLASPRNAKDR